MSVGLGLAGLGLMLMSGLDMGSTWTALLVGFLVGGAGIGLLNPVIADVAVSVVPKEQSGMASGINDTFRQVGIAVGIATWGAIFLGRGADKIDRADRRHPRRDRRAPAPADRGDRRRATSTRCWRRCRSPPGRAVENAAREGFLSGINEILVLGGAALLRRRPGRALARPRGRDRARAGRGRVGAGSEGPAGPELRPRAGARSDQSSSWPLSSSESSS